MANYTIFETIVSLGLWTYVVRKIAADHSRAGSMLLRGCAPSAIIAISTSAAMCLSDLGYTADVCLLVAIMSLALVPAGVSLYGEAALVAFERPRVANSSPGANVRVWRLCYLAEAKNAAAVSYQRKANTVHSAQEREA